MQELFTSVIALVFKDLFLLVGIAIMLINMNWRLALTAFIVLPAVGYFSIHYSRQGREAFRIIRTKTAEINTHFSETITGMKVIQLFRQEADNYQKFKKINHEYYVAGMRQVHVFAIFMPVIELLGIMAVAIIIYYGGIRVLSDQITIGALAAFISYIKMFFRPIRDIAEKYNILQNAMSSAERLFQILDNTEKDAPLIIEETGLSTRIAEEPLSVISYLEAREISFSYVKDEPILKNVSFEIKAGDTLAIVGPTGSGKTTLMNLVTRFYTPDAGRILINGKDIQSIDSGWIRDRIALVTQDPFLFSESIRENILHGAKALSESELEQVVAASNCKDVVDKLPRGLDTILSEGASSISSGERQLISIARAFARNPDMIILDEATSYIDSQTEQKIQKALVNLMTGRTAIIIAHRLSTARLANQILVLNKGLIIESGTHDALMSKKGFYYMLNLMEKIH
jgi:ATP-binding cassette subfamily B protein